ncbi:UNVERIFIED_CONTAM: hypothetical protein FKN15_022956 [Acipenser sinensis]
MAHPPHSDSDITLQDWLNEVLLSDKGIKLDFKSDSDITLQDWLNEVLLSDKGIKLDFKRYSLSVWTGKDDVYPVEDLLYLRKNFDKSRIFYDITEAQDAAFKKAIGYSSIVK